MLLGCRSGAACPFRHEALDTARAQLPLHAAPARRSQQTRPVQHSVPAAESPIVSPGSTTGRQHAAVNTSRITQRPSPQSQLADPRAFEISQLRRRFTPDESSSAGESEGENNRSMTLTFRLRPSDPDFPFDMDALHCSLRVPFDYPNGGKPTLRVTNPEMERGYQINVERGFDSIVAASRSQTLLGYFNSLDKQLERLLSSEKADTIKLVSHPRKLAQPQPPQSPAAAEKASITVIPTLTSTPVVHSKEDQLQAKILRDAECRQLLARMGRLPQFSTSSDGLTFTLPLEPRKRNHLPTELQALKQIRLIVPEAYNLSPCRLELVGVKGLAADAVRDAFAKRARELPDMSLLNHVNYLSQNLHTMAKPIEKPKDRIEESPQLPASEVPQTQVGGDPARQTQISSAATDRPHVVTIARPPEWDVVRYGDADSSDSSSEDEDGTDVDETPHAGGSSNAAQGTTSTSETGVSVSFPHLDLHGIELLELGSLNIQVKCDRCKQTKDVMKLQDNSTGTPTRTDSCKKCAAQFAIGTRPGSHERQSHANVLKGFVPKSCTSIRSAPATWTLTGARLLTCCQGIKGP